MQYNILSLQHILEYFVKFVFWKKQVWLVSAQSDIMMKGKQLFKFDVNNRIIGKHEAGIRDKTICEHLNGSKSSTQSTIIKYKYFCSTAILSRSGRPRKIPIRMVRKIDRLVKNNPRATRKHLQEHLAQESVIVSLINVPNILHEAEFHGRRLRTTPLLNDVSLEARLKFARELMDRDNIFWRYVSWSDETEIELFGQIDVTYA